ncbi:MAG: D-3-phosphoglycerate dehydrogenase, partial [uncultured Acetobacteraceae bacterium]
AARPLPPPRPPGSAGAATRPPRRHGRGDGEPDAGELGPGAAVHGSGDRPRHAHRRGLPRHGARTPHRRPPRRRLRRGGRAGAHRARHPPHRHAGRQRGERGGARHGAAALGRAPREGLRRRDPRARLGAAGVAADLRPRRPHPARGRLRPHRRPHGALGRRLRDARARLRPLRARQH